MSSVTYLLGLQLVLEIAFEVTPNFGRPGGCTRPISAFSLTFTRRLSQGAGVYTSTSPSGHEIWITQLTIAVGMLEVF